MHTPEPRLTGVSVREAAIRLGTSESDVRRRIRRGELRAESIARPGGTLLRVLLDEPEPRQPIESEPAPEPRQDAPALTLGLLDDVRRLAAENAELRERVGRAETVAAYADRERQRADDLAETLIALRASLSAKEHEADELRERLARRRWWWPWSG